LSLPLIVGEEERTIGANRTADHGAKLVAAKERLDGVRRREEVPRVQRLVTEELEHAAADDVRAGFRGEVDDAAVEPAEFRRRAVGLDLELLNRVDVGRSMTFRLSTTWPKPDVALRRSDASARNGHRVRRPH
jgi:hypothetical protein